MPATTRSPLIPFSFPNLDLDCMNWVLVDGMNSNSQDGQVRIVSLLDLYSLEVVMVMEMEATIVAMVFWVHEESQGHPCLML